MVRPQQVVVLLAGVALIGGCAGPSWNKAGGTSAPKPVVLTLANFIGSSNELDGFAGEVQRLSAGAIRIEIRNGWRLGQVGFETGLIADVRAGQADLGVVGAEAWASVGVSSFRALDAPLLIDSYALQDRVLRSPMIGQMLSGLRPLGLAGIGVLPGPLRKPLGIARPLLRPSDYAGLTIGTQQSPIAAATLRALGARPVWFPSEGPITGLGGIEQEIGQIQEVRYDKVGKYLTANVSLWPRPLVLFASGQTWARLTPLERRILRQAVTGDQGAQTQFVRGAERSEAAILCRRGLLRFLTASAADLAALRRAVQPVYGQLEGDPQTWRYIRQIEVMRKGISAEPAPGCAQTPRLAGKAGPLDGVWQVTDTAAELRAAPVTSAGDVADVEPENYGTWTLVLDRGRFAITQEDRLACTWGYGTFAVTGNRIEWLFTDGGGIEPDGSANKPGEFFTFRWSLYRGVLTLSSVAGAVSPSNFRVKPWAMISTTPSPSYLSKRCLPPAGALPP
jgi:TRAP-type C4-dicarboxylate transport system substrate-binding protein